MIVDKNVAKIKQRARMKALKQLPNNPMGQASRSDNAADSCDCNGSICLKQAQADIKVSAAKLWQTRQAMAQVALDQPWAETLANEQMSDEDDERFARYTRDLVHGLETIKKYPQGVTVFGSARFHPSNKFYQAAYELGAKLAQHNHTVTTGGGPGIMEAANRGAFENHGRSVGLNIHLRTEQDLNPWTTDSMEFRYFFSRKVMMTFSSKMFVFFPGGFGTMDEFGEVLELVHTGKMPHSPIILYGKEFWTGLDQWFGGPMSAWHLIETGDPNEMNEMSHVTAADFGMVKNARNLYYITDDIDEIVKIADQTDPRDIQDVFDQVTACQLFGHCD